MSSSLAAPLAPPQLWLIKISSSTLYWWWGQHCPLWGGWEEEEDDEADLVLHPKLLPQLPQQIFLWAVSQECRARSIESCLWISFFPDMPTKLFLALFSFMIVSNVFLPLPSGFRSGPRSASAPAGRGTILRDANYWELKWRYNENNEDDNDNDDDDDSDADNVDDEHDSEMRMAMMLVMMRTSSCSQHPVMIGNPELMLQIIIVTLVNSILIVIVGSQKSML